MSLSDFAGIAAAGVALLALVIFAPRSRMILREAFTHPFRHASA